MPHIESALRPGQPAPFHHPYWESPRQRQHREAAEELSAYIAMCDARRARLSHARVLEVVR